MENGWTEAAIARAVCEAAAVRTAIRNAHGDLGPAYLALAKGLGEFERITRAAGATLLFDDDVGQRYSETGRGSDFWVAYQRRLRRLACENASARTHLESAGGRTDALARAIVAVLDAPLTMVPLLGPMIAIVQASGLEAVCGPALHKAA